METDIKKLTQNWKQAHLERYPAKESGKRGLPGRDHAIRIIDRLLDEETSDQ